MLQETEARVTISFYKYFHIADPQQFRNNLYIQFDAIGVFGRVYIAKEGINGQISVPQSSFGCFSHSIVCCRPGTEWNSPECGAG